MESVTLAIFFNKSNFGNTPTGDKKYWEILSSGHTTALLLAPAEGLGAIWAPRALSAVLETFNLFLNNTIMSTPLSRYPNSFKAWFLYILYPSEFTCAFYLFWWWQNKQKTQVYSKGHYISQKVSHLGLNIKNCVKMHKTFTQSKTQLQKITHRYAESYKVTHSDKQWNTVCIVIHSPSQMHTGIQGVTQSNIFTHSRTKLMQSCSQWNTIIHSYK